MCFAVVHFSPASAGSLKQLWNKVLRYDNQRLDYQPYLSSFNYLNPPAASLNYPPSLNNFNVMNGPMAESSSLHRSVVSLPPAPSNLQGASSLANQMPMSNLANVPNLMTSESINNQHLSLLPQQMPPIQHLSPEFLYDFGQKPNGYSMESLRNLNNLQSMNPGLSLTSLTPLLLLSSLGTLSSKSLANSGGQLSPAVSTSFLKGITSYLSSYLPSSPRQRKRQIDRNLPPALPPNAYSKLTPMESFVFQQSPLTPLGSQIKTTVSSYDASFKKYSRFNKKKPVKYVKPLWLQNNMKKPYNMKQKQQIKYSKLMNESGFVSRQNLTAGNGEARFKPNKRPEQSGRYSEPDKNESGRPDNENNQNLTKTSANQEDDQPSQQQQQQSTNRSVDSSDKVNSDKEEKPSEKSGEKANEESTTTEEEQRHHSIELTSNQPQTDNLENFAHRMYK